MSEQLANPLERPINPPPGPLRVWRYLRKIDDAILFDDSYPLFTNYPGEADEHTTPDEIMVDPEWYASLPEDPGP